TPGAGGIRAPNDDRLNSIFENGSTAAKFRHKQDLVDAFGAWSAGRVGGWVQRYSVGVNYQKDAYNAEAGLPAPQQLPADQTLVAPYLPYEVVQDAYQRYKNLDLIQRPHYFVI